MRLQQFQGIIEKLQTDPYFGIEVFDLTSGVGVILKKSSKEDIEVRYGSVEDFFDNIFIGATTEVGIRTLRKNGTSNHGRIQHWKNGSEPFLKFQSEQEQVTEPQPSEYQGTMLNAPGLNVPFDKYSDLKYDSREKERLENQVKELLAKNKSLKRKNKAYQKRELSEEKAIRKMEVKNEGYNKMLQNGAPLLQPLIEKFSSIIQTPDPSVLASPVRDNLSPNKRSLIDAIEKCDEMTATIIGTAYDGLTIDEFANELNELFLKHNLTNE